MHQCNAPQFGYLLTCPRTGARPGSVQAPGPSLSIRLPTLVVWLSSGLREPGAAVQWGEAQEGFVLLELAVPSPLPGLTALPVPGLW